MYITESEGATGCLNCDTTDNGKESPYRLMDSKNLDKIRFSSENRCPIAKFMKRKPITCNPITKSLSVVLLIIISALALIFPPLDLILWEKLNMRPGLPPFDWWADPPDEIKMRIHVFNITNHERFLSGLDDKINIVDIGPIVYLEKLTHSDIRFHDNDTMSYRADRNLIYLPEDNTLDMNATVVVPNIAVLGLLSYLYNENFFVRAAIKLLMRQHNSELFVKTTIYQFLWEFNDPIVGLAGRVVPGLLPITNVGILNVIYYDISNDITVKIGPRWGHKHFFNIENVRGVPQMGLIDPNVCPDRVTGSTEGVMYPQYLSKEDVLLYFRQSLCKVVPLYFEKEAVMEGVPVYRYNLAENIFDRLTNVTDCFASDPPLLSGLSDASKCFFNFPLVASYPHFYTGSPTKDTYVTGLTPDRSQHSSYVYVEPNTGVPFESVARMQCNLYIHDMSVYGTAELNKFSNLVLPLSWIEYKQEGLPNRMKYMIYFIIVILPPLAKTVFGVLLVVSCLVIIKKLFQKPLTLFSIIKRRKVDDLENNTIGIYEKEMFIKDPK